jgi:hypothetical protein
MRAKNSGKYFDVEKRSKLFIAGLDIAWFLSERL